MQDLVFGRKGRSKAVQSPAKGKGGEVSTGSGSWLKNRNARAIIARSKAAGGGKGVGGGWSSASTHAPHYASGSSIHSGAHSRCVGVGVGVWGVMGGGW